MTLHMLKSKIHRATITDAVADYEGSLSLDHNLMQAADVHEFEKVLVANITNGSRAETYLSKLKRDLGRWG